MTLYFFVSHPAWDVRIEIAWDVRMEINKQRK